MRLEELRGLWEGEPRCRTMPLMVEWTVHDGGWVLQGTRTTWPPPSTVASSWASTRASGG